MSRKLTPEEREQIILWFKKVASNNLCESCHTEKWDLREYLGNIQDVSPYGVPGPSGVPYAIIECGNCGYARFYNYLIITK